MSVFGLQPFGDVAPWGGPGTISLITILAVGTNELIAFFTDPPKVRDPLGFQDARNTLLWEITAVDPIDVGIDGEIVVEPGRRRPSAPARWLGEIFVDTDDPTQVHLRTVPGMEPGIEYDVGLAGTIRGKLCEEFEGLMTFRVGARNPAPPLRSRFAAQDTFRDYSNPFFEIDPKTGLPVTGPGFWKYDDAGDIVLDDAAASLKKRVLRRIQTLVGSFSHLPRYGIRNFSKQLGRGFEIQELAIRLQEQLRDEPDVRDASVNGIIEQTVGGGIMRFEIKVQARAIGEVSFRVQVPAGGI